MTRLRSSPLFLALGAAAALAVVVLVLVAARGGDAATGGADPAQVAPARVAVFGEVLLHPPGQQGKDLRKLLVRALGAGDTGARVSDLVRRAIDGGRGSTDYRRDVAPWLGARAGVFFRALAGARARGTLILAARDEGRARAALLGAGTGARRAYRGVAYARRPDGTFAALVDGFAVIGDEAGVRASIEAAKGYALAGSDRYQTRVRRVKGERIGLVYFDLLSFGDLLRPGLVSPATARQLRERLAITDPDPVLAVMTAKPRAVLFDFGPRPGDVVGANGQGADAGDGGTPPGEAGSGADQSAPGQGGGTKDAGVPEAAAGSPAAPTPGLSPLPTSLLPELPADTWLAVGITDFGQRASELTDPSVSQSLPLDELARLARRFAGNGVRGRVFPTLGGIALFLRGSTPGRLEGGAVIESLDPAATRPAVRRLAVALGEQDGWRRRAADLPGAPGGFRLDAPKLRQPVYLLARGDRIVVALGRAAATDALDAPRKLGTTPGFRAAAATLAPTLRPDSFLDLRAALRVLDATGAARVGAYRGARPLLEPFSWVVFAARNRVRRFGLGI